MGEWRQTPVDEIGMPLLLRPPDYPVLYDRPDLFDRNHSFHPASDPILSDDSGQALRNSRIQFCDWWEHHNGYHETFSGSPIPTDRAEKFGLIVMAAALYIPDKVIDCRDIDPVVVRLRPDERERLWKTGEVRMASTSVVRSFLMEYMVGQDLTHIKEQTIDEFLYTDDYERRRFLGHWLLAQAADQATEQISPVYRMAYREGRIPRSLPSGPRMMLQRQLGPARQRERIVKQLQTKLSTAA